MPMLVLFLDPGELVQKYPKISQCFFIVLICFNIVLLLLPMLNMNPSQNPAPHLLDKNSSVHRTLARDARHGSGSRWSCLVSKQAYKLDLCSHMFSSIFRSCPFHPIPHMEPKSSSSSQGNASPMNSVRLRFPLSSKEMTSMSKRYCSFNRQVRDAHAIEIFSRMCSLAKKRSPLFHLRNWISHDFPGFKPYCNELFSNN